MKCGACGRTGLRSTQLAIVLDGDSQEMRWCCGRCIGRGLRLVAATKVSAHPTVATEQERDTRDVLRSLAKELRGMARLYANSRGYSEPHVRGLEQAADVAEAWADRPAARKEGT